MDLLCSFAHQFPHLAAQILDRDRHKTRNFREETITDMLMAGLVPFEPLGIICDFPKDESSTGEDMDWEFVDENAADGRRYLRLHIQAKRAHRQGKKSPYWLYRELDHAGKPAPGAPKGAPPVYGTQHERLVEEATKIAGCIPLYMFYNPASALDRSAPFLPAIEGVNWIFADEVSSNLSPKRWPVADKKLEKFRPNFRPLSDLLCLAGGIQITASRNRVVLRFVGRGAINPTPGEIADRLNERRGRGAARESTLPVVRAVEEIPRETLDAVRAARRKQRLDANPSRPRAIFMADPRRIRPPK